MDLGSLAGSILSAARAPPMAPASDMPASAAAPTSTRTFRLRLPTNLNPRCMRDLEHSSTFPGRFLPRPTTKSDQPGAGDEGAGDEGHTPNGSRQGPIAEGAPGC